MTLTQLIELLREAGIKFDPDREDYSIVIDDPAVVDCLHRVIDHLESAMGKHVALAARLSVPDEEALGDHLGHGRESEERGDPDPIDREDDDPRSCRHCLNLSVGGFCKAARSVGGLSKGCRPNQTILHRCRDYRPNLDDPDRRLGHERWPDSGAPETKGDRFTEGENDEL